MANLNNMCFQTLARNTYSNYGSYLNSRGYDKEICNFKTQMTDGTIPFKAITVNNPDSGNHLVIKGNVWIQGKLVVSDSSDSLVPILPAAAGTGFQWNASSTPTNNTYFTNNAITTPSSLRYKFDVSPYLLPEATKLLNISAKSYKYKNSPAKTHVGVIAEDLHEAGLGHFVGYDSENRPDSVNYGAIVAPLIELVKHLNTRVSALEQKLANQ